MAAKNFYIAQLRTAKRELAMQHKTLRPKIQKVHQTLIKDEEQYELYYKPKLVSFGPIHHRLALGESQKFTWAAACMEEYCNGSENAEQLCQKIAENIVQLKKLYTEDVIEGYSDEELTWMLLVDGCAMLYLLILLTDFDHKNEKIQLAHVSLVVKDLLLLENQLPYDLLKLLTNSSERLMKCMDVFCESLYPIPKPKIPRNGKHSPEQSNNAGGPQHTMSVEDAEDDPVHLLDHMRKLILATRSLRINEPKSGGCMDVVKSCCDGCLTWKKPISRREAGRNIQNMTEAGILRVKRDDDATLSDTSFHPGPFTGYLHLPPLLIGKRSALLFRNLKAYELCPDFDNEFEICSFLVFIDLLVNCEEDVKELRSAGVLLGVRVKDTKVVELISDMSRDLIFLAPLYGQLLNEMSTYFNSKYRTWAAEAYYTYFRSPWTIIACIAAGTGLVLTLIQTVQGSNSRSA